VPLSLVACPHPLNVDAGKEAAIEGLIPSVSSGARGQEEAEGDIRGRLASFQFARPTPALGSSLAVPSLSSPPETAHSNPHHIEWPSDSKRRDRVAHYI
jgi:hypothetical protein